MEGFPWHLSLGGLGSASPPGVQTHEDAQGCALGARITKDYYCNRFFTTCRQDAVTPVKQNEIKRPSPQVDAATFCNLDDGVFCKLGGDPSLCTGQATVMRCDESIAKYPR